jgi:hypothetical protein
MISRFEIFISYAHFDNEPVAEVLKGWVETFPPRSLWLASCHSQLANMDDVANTLMGLSGQTRIK